VISSITFGRILIISLKISQELLMSELSFKLSKVANLFEICTWYLSLSSALSSFFRSNLSQSNSCLAHLLTEIISLNYGTTMFCSISQSASLKDRTSNNMFECRLLSIKT
jgi:hypothetical protein